jgi:hypothetical protein
MWLVWVDPHQRESKRGTGQVGQVNDTGGKLPPVSTTPAVNLPLVSTTPVANNWNNIRMLTPVNYTGLSRKYLREFSKKLQMALM